MTFKQALASAADQSLASGAIGPESHAELAEIATSSVNRAAIIERAAAYRLGETGSVDWTSLVAAIQTLLPLILQIIALFKKPA